MESGGGGNRLVENVQSAIEELRGAAEKATGDVRTNIDSAVQRLRDASSEAGSAATDQVSTFRSILENATEEARREFGRLAVRAQSSVESIEELAKEVDERRKTLGGTVTGAVKEATESVKDAAESVRDAGK